MTTISIYYCQSDSMQKKPFYNEHYPSILLLDFLEGTSEHFSGENGAL